MVSNIKPKILLVGGGGHCKSVIDVIEQENIFEIAGIIEKDIKSYNDILGYKVVGADKDLAKLREFYDYAIVTIGQITSNEARKRTFHLLKKFDYKLPVIISPYSYVSKSAKIEEGTVILHHVIVNTNSYIGKNCIINSRALIEHDASVGDNCHISTGAIVNGSSKVLEDSFVGSNSVIVNNRTFKGFLKAGSLYK